MPKKDDLTNHIVDFLKNNPQDGGWKPKIIALKLSKILKKPVNPNSVYTILSRLEKDPNSNVKKVARGFYAYTGEPELNIDDIIFTKPLHEQIPKIHNLTLVFNPKKVGKWMELFGITSRTKLSEMKRLSIVRNDVRNENEENIGENPETEHKLTEIFLKSNKKKVGLSKLLPNQNIKPFPIELKVNPFVVGDPMHQDSLFQRYRFDTKSPKQVKGGNEESFSLPDGRNLTVQIFGTGSVNIYIEMTENPADIIDLHSILHGYLEAFFSLKFGYLFSDVSSLFFVSRCEFNYDKEKKESFSSDIPYGIRSVTASELENWSMQVYEKHLNGELVVREEYQFADWEKPQPINSFEQTLATIHMGGMTTTAVAMALKDIHKTMEAVTQKDEKHDNMLEFLFKLTQKQGSDMQKMGEIIKKQNEAIEKLLKKVERSAE